MEGAISMSIYTVLGGEHNEVKALFATLRATPGSGKKAVFDKIYAELISHSRAEQETVYDVAAERIPFGIIDEAEEEHAEMERILNELREKDVGSSDWMQRFEALVTAVQDHVTEEEGRMFQEMREVFSDDEARQMAKEFRDAKKVHLENIQTTA